MLKKFRAVWKIRKIQKKKFNSLLPNFSLALRENFDTPEIILGILGKKLYCPIISGMLERLKKIFIYAQTFLAH
jgi:hypothetical protein